ncbi:MAG: hypothetical protein ACI4X9_05050 [Kiritimatiellia bacterium]
MTICRPILAATIAAACVFAAAAAEKPWLIFNGWERPDVDLLKKHLPEIEAAAPFDGLLFDFGLSGVFSGKTLIEHKAFRRTVATYQSIPFKRYRHNFLYTLIDKAKPLWFDDAYWKTVADNFALAARTAKKCSMAGLCFDPECYGIYPVNSYWTSDWFLKDDAKNNPSDNPRTKEAYRAIARQRGKEVGKAIFAEFPDCIFWGYYLWSFRCDLLSAFCNGLLEAMPPQARLVDGDEWRGYCSSHLDSYKTQAIDNRAGFSQVEPKLRQKHLRQGGLAPAFYLDFYADPKSTLFTYQHRDLRETRADRLLKRQLAQARRSATGGFIWIYGEKGSWWDWKALGSKRPNSYPNWEERIPCIGRVLFGENAPKPWAHIH